MYLSLINEFEFSFKCFLVFFKVWFIVGGILVELFESVISILEFIIIGYESRIKIY